MRIISQNMSVDVNYDNNDLQVVNKEIFINRNSHNSKITWLGGYETNKRALEVMKEIRESYIGDSQKVLINEDTFDVKVFPKIHYFYMPKE